MILCWPCPRALQTPPSIISRTTLMTNPVPFHQVLSPTHPATPSRLAAHKTQFPLEAAPLRDTSRTILGRPHTVHPDVAATTTDGENASFVPVGHISLDGWHADPSLQTSAADGVFSLTTFYVSGAMQGVGIGGAAVAECER